MVVNIDSHEVTAVVNRCNRMRGCAADRVIGADRRLPRRSVGHQLLRRGDGSRLRVRGHRPRHGRHRGRRRGRRASTGSSRSPCWSPTATSTTCGASPPWPAGTTPPPGSTPATGTCSPTRWPACRRETARMLLGGDYSWEEPDDVRELGDLQELELAGVRFVVDHTPGHTEGSVTFRTPYPDQAEIARSCSPATCCSRARSAGPTSPAVTTRRCCAASPPRCCRWPTTSSCCPATASRPRSVASGRPTRSCRTCRRPRLTPRG